MPDRPDDTPALPSAAAMSPDEVRRVDAAHVWHPYADVSVSPEHVVVGASGAELTVVDAAGVSHRVVDAMASWWSVIHGYRHPVLDAAARAQLDDFSHVMFGSLTHAPAARLAHQLVELSPVGLSKVFLADSGSVSVEVALKMAIQVAQGRGRSGKKFAALRGAYHGDTAGAMSVCDPDGGLHHQFGGALIEQVFLPQPPAAAETGGVVAVSADVADVAGWADAVRQIIAEHHAELAGIIAEPILQGVGSMHAYPAQCLTVLRQLADEFGLCLIVDEIATGFGRTGALFACDHAGITPDIMCVGKALTGGYLTMAAVLCTDQVAADIAASDSGVLMHGPTFMANPLACAVASASLTTLQTDDWAASVRRIQAGLAAGLAPAARLPRVASVRVLGAVGVISCDSAVDAAAVTAAAVRRGVWLRPFRHMVYTMPPYVTNDDQLACMATGMVEAVAEVHR